MAQLDKILTDYREGALTKREAELLIFKLLTIINGGETE